uniref:Uncharacterized protein n=1 Tax=Anguilla anguilla TaxID=7936 RepID=A0A0E9V510_ANGAN
MSTEWTSGRCTTAWFHHIWVRQIRFDWVVDCHKILSGLHYHALAKTVNPFL